MDPHSSEIDIKKEEEPLLSPSVRANLDPKIKLDTLTNIQVIGYGLGHFLNDLCAACWFNYLLYFMKSVVFKGDPDSGFYAGIVLLSGQIADGIATPLVGVYSDKTETKIGKRTPWYIFGFVCVAVCFVFIFQECLLCKWFNSESKGLLIFYYIFFPSAFNIGWAAMQVAHMSLVPSLTLSRKTRDKLNNLRNTFTYIANLYVLAFAFLVFLVLDNDFLQFEVLSLGSLTVGVITSIFFLTAVNEKKITQDCKQIQKQFKRKYKLSIDSQTSVPNNKLSKLEHLANGTRNDGTSLDNIDDISSPASPISHGNGNKPQSDYEKWELSDDETGNVHLSSRLKKSTAKNSIGDEIVSWKQWFHVPAFYLYGFVYMCVRLLVNVQSSLIIFYLENVLGIEKGDETKGLPIEFALIPMIVYLSSSVASSNLKTLYQRIGRKKTFAVGALAALAGIGVMMFLNGELKNLMYPLAIVIGLGQSICLNTGISLIAEVVGAKGASGAFVFGSYSLLDKFACGLGLYAVMNIQNVSDPKNSEYVRICTCIIPAVSVIMAWILIAMGKAADYDAGDLVMDKQDVEESGIAKGKDEIN